MHGVERRARVLRVEVVRARSPARRTSRRTARRGARSTCPPAACSRPGAGRRARSGRSRLTRRRRGSRARRSARARARAWASPAIQSVIAPERMSDAGASAMSTMFTPALPSSRATWATIPGRFGTVRRSSWTGPLGRAGLEQRAPVLARAVVPVARPRRASSRRSTSSSSRRNAADLLDDRGAVRAVDVASTSPCWRRPRASCRGSSGPTWRQRLAVLGQPRGGLRDEHVGQHVRQVAEDGHEPVVGLGVDRDRPGAEVRRRSGAGARRGGRRTARAA